MTIEENLGNTERRKNHPFFQHSETTAVNIVVYIIHLLGDDSLLWQVPM